MQQAQTMQEDNATLFCFFVSLVAALLFLYFIIFNNLRGLKPRCKHPPPTLPSLPIVGHLHLLLRRQPLHRALAALSSRHGPILLLRFGSRPTLVVSSASLAQSCFTANDITFANRPKLLAGKIIGYNYAALGWSSYGPLFRDLRRISTLHLLSSLRVAQSAPIRSRHVRSLLKSLCGGKAEASRVEMKSRLMDLTYGVMMEMICAEEEEAARSYKEVVEEVFKVTGVTNLGDFIGIVRWLGLGGMDRRLRELRRKRDEFWGSLIEKRREKQKGGFDQGEERRRTMIDVMLELQEAEPGYYTDDILKGMVTVCNSMA